MITCILCNRTIPSNSHHDDCDDCRPIRHMCCTSAEDGIRRIRQEKSLQVLERGQIYEAGKRPRKSVMKAFKIAIKRARKHGTVEHGGAA